MSICLLCIQLQYIERDFSREFLFRTCSVATDLEMSLELNPIRWATMLCLFGYTRNGSVATHFFLVSSATGGYLAVPERFGQNEEPATRNKERTRNSPVPLQKCN